MNPPYKRASEYTQEEIEKCALTLVEWWRRANTMPSIPNAIRSKIFKRAEQIRDAEKEDR